MMINERQRQLSNQIRVAAENDPNHSNMFKKLSLENVRQSVSVNTAKNVTSLHSKKEPMIPVSKAKHEKTDFAVEKFHLSNQLHEREFPILFQANRIPLLILSQSTNIFKDC